MKYLLLTVLIFNHPTNYDCENYGDAMRNVKAYADEAFRFCKRANDLVEKEDIKPLIKKVMELSENTEDEGEEALIYAEKCNCHEGQKFSERVAYLASEMFTHAQKAYQTDDFDEIKYHLGRVIQDSKECLNKAKYGALECK